MAVSIATVGDATSTSSGTTINVDCPASVAVGDLLIVHLVMADTGSTWDTLSGWTSIQQGTTGTLAVAAFYKIADSGDAAASTIEFTRGDSGASGGRMFRITGHNPANPINASNVGATANSATVTVTTITPSVAQSLMMFLVGSDNDGSARTCSGYALATSSPTFTEYYDEQFNSAAAQMSAAAGVRAATTGTGDATATLTGLDPNVGILIAVEAATVNVTVSPSVLTATFNIQDPTVSIVSSVTVTPTVISATFSIQAPTVSTNTTGSWTNRSKSSSTWNNQDKS